MRNSNSAQGSWGVSFLLTWIFLQIIVKDKKERLKDPFQFMISEMYVKSLTLINILTGFMMLYHFFCIRECVGQLTLTSTDLMRQRT